VSYLSYTHYSLIIIILIVHSAYLCTWYHFWRKCKLDRNRTSREALFSKHTTSSEADSLEFSSIYMHSQQCRVVKIDSHSNCLHLGQREWAKSNFSLRERGGGEIKLQRRQINLRVHGARLNSASAARRRVDRGIFKRSERESRCAAGLLSKSIQTTFNQARNYLTLRPSSLPLKPGRMHLTVSPRRNVNKSQRTNAFPPPLKPCSAQRGARELLLRPVCWT